MSEEFPSRSAYWLAASIIPLALIVLAALGVTDRRRGVILVCAIGIALVMMAYVLTRARPNSKRLTQIQAAIRALREGVLPAPIAGRRHGPLGSLEHDVDALAQVVGDLARARADAEFELNELVHRDRLTGAYSRRHAIDELTGLLETDDQGTVTIVHVDIDDFKGSNEVWGHDTGDEILVTIANRLRRLVADQGTVARWSGDEFMLVTVGVERSDADQLADRVRSLAAEPITTQSGVHRMTASVGVATAVCGAGVRLDHLLLAAEDRVAEEKDARRAARSIDPETVRLVEFALEEGRLEVWYQPIVRMTSSSATALVGAEALTRIRSADGSLHLPGDFFARIMTSEWARRIDLRVAETVICDLRTWQIDNMAPDDFLVSLNLSPASLRDPDLCPRLTDLCAKAGVEHSSLVLELSEEAGELDQIIAIELRRKGFRLAIDDLGRKRSNFDRLLTVGAEFAKLHPRWLDDGIMLDALVDICKGKGLEVVAEGVETMDQFELLRSRNVELCQGYLISPPLAVPDFENLLSNGRSDQRPASLGEIR